MNLDDFRKWKKNKSSNKNEKEMKDLELVTLVKSKYNAAYSAKAKLHETWKKNKQAYTGELFKKNLPDYKANQVSNYVFSTVETVKPIMLSNYPQSIALPRSSDNFAKSKLVQNALDFEWRREKMFEKLTHMCHYTLVYGTAGLYLPWDANDFNGLGNVKAVVLSPFNIFPDPRATNEDDAEYMIYACYKPLGELTKAFPDKAEELKNQVTSNTDGILSQDDNNLGGSNNILYLECYIKDYAVETQIEDELDEDGEPTGNKYKITRSKYPNGRRIIIGGDVLLYDGVNPYKDGKVPIRIWRCYTVPDSFWGISEVENIVSPQEHMSKLTNSILENAALMGNPVWIVDNNSGVAKNSLTNRPGLVVRKNPGTDVERPSPPTIPAYTMEMVNVMKADIERISGVFDVTRGERPTGVTAASAITALQETAQSRIRLKVQLLEETISEIGAMWLSRMQQFWDTTRTIRVMGGSYRPNEEADTEFEEMYGAGEMSLQGKKYKFYDVSKDDLDGDFDIEIVTGSTMNKNRSAMLQNLISMAQTPAEDGLPMIDRQTLLENSDIANVEEILERFEQLRNVQAENASAEQNALNEQQLMQQQMAEEQKMNEEAMKAEQQMQTEQIKAENKMSEKQMDNEAKILMKQMDIESKPEKEGEGKVQKSDNTAKTLQPQQEATQYTEEDLGMIEEIIASLGQLSEEELMALAEENPDIMKLLQILGEVQQNQQM